MKHQDTKTMIGLLMKAQEAQIKVAEINDGHSIHIDQSCHRDLWKEAEEYYMCFDVTLFYGTEIVGSWDFHSLDSYDDLNHKMDDLFFQIGRI